MFDIIIMNTIIVLKWSTKESNKTFELVWPISVTEGIN